MHCFTQKVHIFRYKCLQTRFAGLQISHIRALPGCLGSCPERMILPFFMPHLVVVTTPNTEVWIHSCNYSHGDSYSWSEHSILNLLVPTVQKLQPLCSMTWGKYEMVVWGYSWKILNFQRFLDFNLGAQVIPTIMGDFKDPIEFDGDVRQTIFLWRIFFLLNPLLL